MNRTVQREPQYHQGVHKLITSLCSKLYWPSGMLIHWQNFYAPCGKERTVRREVQSRGPVNKVKNLCIVSVKPGVTAYRYTYLKELPETDNYLVTSILCHLFYWFTILIYNLTQL
jgi:hypothetical protein